MMVRFSQLCKLLVAFFPLSALNAWAADAQCEKVPNTVAVSCAVDPARADLRLFWRGEGGEPYGGFSKVADAVSRGGGRLAFAMNAGMFQPDLSPVGLYVEGGQELRPVNRRAGEGNFGMRPNGVLWIDGARAGVTETSRFIEMRIRPRYATQSGPLLVMGGRLHPKIRPDGTSAKIRNGVGACEDGKLRFVITDQPVTFYAFAILFRDVLKCPDALFLDGSISSLYAPALSRNDGWLLPIGPVVGVVEKK